MPAELSVDGEGGAGHRIVESGLFSSCMPVAVDTRDGIRLVFQVYIFRHGTNRISLLLARKQKTQDIRRLYSSNFIEYHKFEACLLK